MKTKANCLKSSFTALSLLLVTCACIAQQQTPAGKAEVVIYKFAKSDYENNGKAIQQSISLVNGVTVNEFCDAYNKIFMILQVDRTIQPNDDNIVISMNIAKIGYKKIKSSQTQDIINTCK